MAALQKETQSVSRAAEPLRLSRVIEAAEQPLAFRNDRPLPLMWSIQIGPGASSGAPGLRYFHSVGVQ